MRGGFLHNEVLVKTMERVAFRHGATVEQEAPTGEGRKVGFIDLLITYRGCRIAVEAELTDARVVNDVAKATAVDADLLLIVMPTAREVRSAQAKLRREAVGRRELETTVLVTTLGQAIQRLKSAFGLLDQHECSGDQKSKTTKRTQTIPRGRL